MTEEEIKDYYNSNEKKFDRLGENLKPALESFLIDKSMPYHAISYRVKEFDSFKIKLKERNIPILKRN